MPFLAVDVLNSVFLGGKLNASGVGGGVNLAALLVFNLHQRESPGPHVHAAAHAVVSPADCLSGCDARPGGGGEGRVTGVKTGCGACSPPL